jgi:hypothetical protein
MNILLKGLDIAYGVIIRTTWIKASNSIYLEGITPEKTGRISWVE